MLFLVIASGCADPGRAGGNDPRLVVCTTGMVADLARRIAGPHLRIEALMGPGVDPHLYKASESDVRRLASADLILYNGLHLEGKMGDILGKMGRERPVVGLGDVVPEDMLRRPAEFGGQPDPHIWFDVRLWSRTVEPAARAIADLVPARRSEIEANGEALRLELAELDRWVEEQIRSIPASQRILVTAHDAFGYFGRRYGIEVVGIQGMSTLVEAGLGDIERVVDLVVSRKVKAIFVEASVPPRAIRSVQEACRARGYEVAIGGQLYSDALGTPGTPEGTYDGMVRANVRSIAEALR